jgi:hypothetical protein
MPSANISMSEDDGNVIQLMTWTDSLLAIINGEELDIDLGEQTAYVGVEGDEPETVASQFVSELLDHLPGYHENEKKRIYKIVLAAIKEAIAEQDER